MTDKSHSSKECLLDDRNKGMSKNYQRSFICLIDKTDLTNKNIFIEDEKNRFASFDDCKNCFSVENSINVKCSKEYSNGYFKQKNINNKKNYELPFDIKILVDNKMVDAIYSEKIIKISEKEVKIIREYNNFILCYKVKKEN